MPDTAESAVPKSAVILRKKAKKPQARNIFLEFGMDSDQRAMTEVEIGGIIVKRFNIKRFWQSDKDLHRWQEGLHDKTRFEKLLIGVRMRCNADYRADQADLTQNHNGFRRQRSCPLWEPKVPAAQELRDLRQKLDPKASKSKKREAPSHDRTGPTAVAATPVKQRQQDTDMSMTSSRGATFESTSNSLGDTGILPDLVEPVSRVVEGLTAQYGSLEAAFQALDHGGRGLVSTTVLTTACLELGLRNEVKAVLKALDKGDAVATFVSACLARGNAESQINKSEFTRLKAYANAHAGPHTTGALSPISSRRGSRASDAEAFSLPPVREAQRGAEAAGAMSRSLSGKFSQVPASKGVALLIFRNADHSHTGEPVHVRRWPPASMADLLKACGGPCQPMIGPPAKLYDTSLNPIRSLEEVVPGATYLLKGQEGLDPPHLFFGHRERASPSLRELRKAKFAAVAEREDVPRRSPMHSTMGSMAPTLGSDGPSPAR